MDAISIIKGIKYDCNLYQRGPKHDCNVENCLRVTLKKIAIIFGPHDKNYCNHMWYYTYIIYIAYIF